MSLSTSNMYHKTSPLLVVVMGVSGTGKSTLANEIANCFDITLIDADSLHSAEAINQMSQGIPLTNPQRAPWIARICKQLSAYEVQGKSCVLAYSGLTQLHRQQIFSAYQKSLGILLNTNQTILAQRLQARPNHFMPPQLLNSQIAAMEPLSKKMARITLTLNAAGELEGLLLQSVSFINLHHHSKMQ